MKKIVTSFGEKNPIKVINPFFTSGTITLTSFRSNEVLNVSLAPFSNYQNISKYAVDYPESKKLVISKTYGFHNAFHEAFTRHLPLELNPDMFWIIILQSLSKHVEKNVKKYRHLFTDSQDKKTIITEAPENDYHQFICDIVSQLKSKIKVDLSLKFSTTSPVMEIVANVTLMNICKEYYGYHMTTLCGIPEFHIYGSTEDWEVLIQKVHDIGEIFKLEPWTNKIADVLINIKKCDYVKDKLFWDSAYKYENEAGSGGNQYVSGWIMAFFLYNSYGSMNNWTKVGERYMEGSLPNQVTATPFVYTKYDSVLNMELLSGFCGVLQDINTNAISPCIGWAIREYK